MEFPWNATQESRDNVLVDFAMAKERLLSTFALKLSFWSVLPWHAAGLGHPDPLVARQCAQECLTPYDKKPEPSLHHRVSNEMFGFEDMSLRRFVTEFVSGGPLKANSAFFFKVILLKFMPVVERVIEMRHSMIKAMLSSKRQRHPVAISLANRGLEIAKRLDLNPSMLAHLGDLLGKVRNGKMVC